MIEVVGGLLLILGLLTRPAALVLAGDMVAAIVVSGIPLGETVSLTIAPAELVICLYLLWTGPGMLALDRSRLSQTRSRSEIPSKTTLDG